MPALADRTSNAPGSGWPLPFRVAVVTAIVVLVIDQLTKWLILDLVMIPPRVISVLPFLNLRLGFNTGVSFSLFSESLAQAVWLVVLVKLGIVLLLLWWAARVLKWSEGMALGLVIGGALGNIIDRMRLGGVVDFLDLYYGEWRWPTFNMADVAITAGVGILLVSGFLVQRANPRQT